MNAWFLDSELSTCFINIVITCHETCNSAIAHDSRDYQLISMLCYHE